VSVLIRSQLREQIERMGAILDQMPEGVVVIDVRQQRVVLANKVSSGRR
jgi:PAS domain-containing protein